MYDRDRPEEDPSSDSLDHTGAPTFTASAAAEASDFASRLGKLSLAIVQGAALSWVTEESADLIHGLFDLKQCMVLEYGADRRFRPAHLLGAPLEACDSGAFVHLAELALEARKPLVVSGEAEPAGPTQTVMGRTVQAAIAVPIAHGAEVFGAIVGFSPFKRAPRMDDPASLSAVADLLGCAIWRDFATARLDIDETVHGLMVDASSWSEVLGPLNEAASRHLDVLGYRSWQPSDAASENLNHDQNTASNRALPATMPARFVAAQDVEGELRQLLDGRPNTLPAPQAIVLLPLPPATKARGTVALFFLGRQPWFGPHWLATFDRIIRSIGDRIRHRIVSQRVRQTLDDAPIGIADRSLDGRWLRVNEQLCKITGYEAHALLGRPVADILHPDDAAKEQTLFDAVRKGELERYTVEKRYIRPDGTVAWVSLTSSAVQNADGKPVYCIIVVQDVTARRAAEAKLRESEERFRQVLIASPVPLMLYSDTGEVLGTSNSWTAVTGYTPADIPTIDDWTRLAFGEAALEAHARIRSALETNGPLQSEFPITTKAGEPRILKFNSVPLDTDARGRHLRLAAAADLTQQRHSEEKLRAADKQKDDFIAMLGHELRNPLAAMNHASQVLREQQVPSPPLSDDVLAARPQAVERALTTLERHSHHMGKLLDGLLEVSRVMRGKIELDTKPVDLIAIARDVLSDLSQSEMARGLTLSLTEDAESALVVGDAVRLTQVVDNLLSNALKYTQAPGTITINLAKENDEVVLQVQDTGDGIEPDLLPDLFEPFRQGRQALDRARGGLGLGLSLVRNLVELHGGTIHASSAGVGQGSVFAVRLPAATRKQSTTATTPAKQALRRIVVIDDNEDAAEMLRFLLQRRGHDVAVAFDGKSGIALVRKLRPDVVVCDIGLPDGVSGFDVATTLRADPELQPLRLVALTGYGRGADQQRCLSAGFDVHLTKPASLNDIELAI